MKESPRLIAVPRDKRDLTQIITALKIARIDIHNVGETGGLRLIYVNGTSHDIPKIRSLCFQGSAVPVAVGRLRIKVAIANYGSFQLQYLKRVIEEFKRNTRHNIDITVYSTIPVDFPYVLFPSSIGTGLTFTCRESMVREINEYDLFIYTENDMLITEDNIEAFLEHSRRLSDGMVSGFIRYDVNKNGERLLTDANPWFNALTKNRTMETFQMVNPHQGCWILLKRDLERAIRSGGFNVSVHNSPMGELEQGASDPYTQCELTKVLPMEYELCERLLIHHLSNKYGDSETFVKRGVTLKRLFSEHLGPEGSRMLGPC